MKFGREYQDFLTTGGFPSQWVDSAISYAKLKKCIKRVKAELASLGLDTNTLHALLNRAEESQSAGGAEKGLRYEALEGAARVTPKLIFLVDEATGEPLDARLSPETRRYICELAVAEKLLHVHIDDSKGSEHVDSVDSGRSSGAPNGYDDSSRRPSAGHRLIEVPLTSDSEFFTILQNELSGLAHLQDDEKHKLHGEIEQVGKSLVKATEPTSRSGKADLEKWRRIFELYIESRIFFAINERDHGVQQFSAAQDRYMKFLARAQQADLMRKFKSKESAEALQQFLHINVELLQNLRFQEINQTAMVKILKKFDKRTSLSAKSAFPSTALTPRTLSRSLSRTLSQQISASILNIIPLLDDYLCPICSELAWRPIRLRCSHIFCIRCLIRLQRDKRDGCPLCREDVVLNADSRDLDEALIRHMRLWFPIEVKEKQRVNEQIALREEFGIEPKGCQVIWFFGKRKLVSRCNPSSRTGFCGICSEFKRSELERASNRRRR